MSRRGKTRKRRGCSTLSIVLIGIFIFFWAIGSANSPQRQASMTQAANTATRVAVRETDVVIEKTVTLTPTTGAAATMRPTTYYATGNANLRSCPRTTCNKVDGVAAGEELTVIGQIEGDAVSAGNTVWYQVQHDRGDAYIYSNLVSTQKPAPVQSSSSSQGFTCPRNCDGAKAMGLSAQQAASCPGLDRDHDGVACYGD